MRESWMSDLSSNQLHFLRPITNRSIFGVDHECGRCVLSTFQLQSFVCRRLNDFVLTTIKQLTHLNDVKLPVDSGKCLKSCRKKIDIHLNCCVVVVVCCCCYRCQEWVRERESYSGSTIMQIIIAVYRKNANSNDDATIGTNN